MHTVYMYIELRKEFYRSLLSKDMGNELYFAK